MLHIGDGPIVLHCAHYKDSHQLRRALLKRTCAKPGEGIVEVNLLEILEVFDKHLL
jgi:hypothetical protein